MRCMEKEIFCIRIMWKGLHAVWVWRLWNIVHFSDATDRFFTFLCVFFVQIDYSTEMDYYWMELLSLQCIKWNSMTWYRYFKKFDFLSFYIKKVFSWNEIKPKFLFLTRHQRIVTSGSFHSVQNESFFTLIDEWRFINEIKRFLIIYMLYIGFPFILQKNTDVINHLVL